MTYKLRVSGVGSMSKLCSLPNVRYKLSAEVYSARITFAASLGSIQNIFNSYSVCPKWEDSLKYAMFPFLGIFSFVSNFLEKFKKI